MLTDVFIVWHRAFETKGKILHCRLSLHPALIVTAVTEDPLINQSVPRDTDRADEPNPLELTPVPVAITQRFIFALTA